MVCPGCGAFIPEDAGFCRACGMIVRGPKGRAAVPVAPPPPGYLAGPAPPPPPGYAAGPAPPGRPPPPPSAPGARPVFPGYPVGGSAPPVWADLPPQGRRVLTVQPTGNDLLVAVLTVVVLVSLFLPFYRYRGSSDLVVINAAQWSALSSTAGGWRWLILGSSLLILFYLLVRALARGQTLPMPIAHAPLLVGLAAANVALMAVAFFSLPFGGFSVSADGVVVGIAQSWGAFVGLSAAVLALAASLFNRSPRVR